jgi:hypothetical protein
MVQIVTKYDDFEIGDIATLKSGSPDLTVIGFEGPEPVTPVFAPGAAPTVAVAQVEAPPVARVAWMVDGVLHIARLPTEAMTLKAETAPATAPAPAPKASV